MDKTKCTKIVFEKGSLTISVEYLGNNIVKETVSNNEPEFINLHEVKSLGFREEDAENSLWMDYYLVQIGTYHYEGWKINKREVGEEWITD